MAEVLVGDLFEEYAIRVKSSQADSAVMWFLMQAVTSIPSLLFLPRQRWFWLKSLFVALIAVEVFMRLEPMVHSWIAGSYEFSLSQQIAITLGIAFLSCVCGGFLATLFQRGAGVLYSLIEASLMLFAIARLGESDPLWIPVSFLLISMIAPLIGAAGLVVLSNRWSRQEIG
jgi:hypothetical protein